VEEIRHSDEIAIGGELISNQLHIIELVAENIGEDYNCCVSGFGTRIGEIDFGFRLLLIEWSSKGLQRMELESRTVTYRFQFAGCRALVLNADGTALLWCMRCHGYSECVGFEVREGAQLNIQVKQSLSRFL
jgi:hypothetical protein